MNAHVYWRMMLDWGAFKVFIWCGKLTAVQISGLEHLEPYRYSMFQQMDNWSSSRGRNLNLKYWEEMCCFLQFKLQLAHMLSKTNFKFQQALLSSCCVTESSLWCSQFIQRSSLQKSETFVNVRPLSASLTEAASICTKLNLWISILASLHSHTGGGSQCKTFQTWGSSHERQTN